MLLWLPCLVPWSFLIQFLFKFDAKCSSGCLASSRGRFSFNSYPNLMQNAPVDALPFIVVVSYSILIRIRWKMLLWIHCISLCSLLIQFLFKLHTKCSSGCLASSRGRFSFNSYSNLMQNPSDAMPLVVIVSYSILIQI